MTMRLTEQQLEWLAERVPDAPVSPRGGRSAIDKRSALRGIFWILDNGAKWKDLPRRFGSKSAVHRWFSLWVREGVFGNIMRYAGQLVEERDGFRLYECFIDGTFSKARGSDAVRAGGGGRRLRRGGRSPPSPLHGGIDRVVQQVFGLRGINDALYRREDRYLYTPEWYEEVIIGTDPETGDSIYGEPIVHYAWCASPGREDVHFWLPKACVNNVGIVLRVVALPGTPRRDSVSRFSSSCVSTQFLATHATRDRGTE